MVEERRVSRRFADKGKGAGHCTSVGGCVRLYEDLSVAGGKNLRLGLSLH